MRIIKNKNDNDYYDGYMNHDRKDRFNKVWVRTESKIQVVNERLKELEFRRLRIYRDGWNTGYLILAGKVVPYVVRSFSDGAKKSKYFYDIKSAVKYFNNQKKPQFYNKWHHWSWNGSIERDLTAFFAGYGDYTDLCVTHQTPILLVIPNMNGYDEEYKPTRTCFKDVNLKDRGLSKVYTAPQLYQILDVFVSNVLVNDDMVMKPISDKVKVELHGFDTKYGFRTRKKDK